MNISGAYPIAQSGMNQATQKLDGAARNIASGKIEPRDVVDVRTAEHSFAANATVMKVADEMLDSLLDVKV